MGGRCCHQHDRVIRGVWCVLLFLFLFGLCFGYDCCSFMALLQTKRYNHSCVVRRFKRRPSSRHLSQIPVRQSITSTRRYETRCNTIVMVKYTQDNTQARGVMTIHALMKELYHRRVTHGIVGTHTILLCDAVKDFLLSPWFWFVRFYYTRRATLFLLTGDSEQC